MGNGWIDGQDLRDPVRANFRPFEDPRDATKRRYNLIDMVGIAMAAVVCVADDWVAVAAYGRAKEACRAVFPPSF